MIFLPSAKFLYRPQTTAAPWTPLSLGNTVLYGWYKGDAGLSVSTDGASVATWADQSTNNKHLSQTTTANQPVFRTAVNGINGIPVLEFPSSATTPAFFNETAFPANTNGFSFYIVSRNAAYSASAQYTGAFVIGDLSSGGINQFCNVPSTPTIQNIRINGLPADFGESILSSNYVVTKASRGTDLTSVKYQTTYTPLRTNGTTNPYSIANGYFIGRNFVGSVGGKIAEVIVCNGELNSTEEASLDAYFRSRYGFGLYYGADLPVANPALWLDASRSDTLYVENTFTTAVTTDNGPVGGWKDLSGNNRHALQSGTNRPTWRTPINGQNGLGVMSFNGSTQYFDVANLPSLASGYTFYGVIKQPTATGAVISSASAGVDGSTAALVARPGVTAVGNAQISTSQSKYGGASAYFDGSGDYLDVSGTGIATAFGTGDFTIEGWIYPTDSTFGRRILQFSDNNDNLDLNLNGAGSISYYNGSSATSSSSGIISLNTWTHIALVRSSGTVKVYVNGFSVLTQSTTPNTSSSRVLYIGGITNVWFNGYVDDLRVTKYARYTSTFTPPAALPDTPATDPYFAQTSLLLHMDGTNGSTVFTDSSNNIGTGITQGGRSIAQPVVAGTVVGVIGNYDGTHTAGNYFVRTSSSAANVSGVMTQTASTPATGTASIGRLTNATAYFNSQIYELVVLPRQSNGTEDQAWKDYTTAKWGITWS